MFAWLTWKGSLWCLLKVSAVFPSKTRIASTNVMRLVNRTILSNVQDSPGICSSSGVSSRTYICSQLLWCRYQYTVTSWIWIRPSDEGMSQMTERCINLSVSPRWSPWSSWRMQSLGSQNPALFTTHSPTESLTRFYSPPQTRSKGRIRLCPRGIRIPSSFTMPFARGTRVTIEEW